ncbi:hypothetical protein B0H19DRAFT_1253163 [Mycena capillaripes]|nr:hypothetical protein B0H19DRAFT_1253163 [Mycena capillaripes]
MTGQDDCQRTMDVCRFGTFAWFVLRGQGSSSPVLVQVGTGHRRWKMLWARSKERVSALSSDRPKLRSSHKTLVPMIRALMRSPLRSYRRLFVHPRNSERRHPFLSPFAHKAGALPRNPATTVFEDWYTSRNVHYPWSCDWARWKGTDKWRIKPGYSRPLIETEFNGPYRLPAPLEPLIFYDPSRRGEWDDFAFVCAGVHYYFSKYDDTVWRYHDTYTSPRAFLRAQLSTFGEEPPMSARISELWEQCQTALKRGDREVAARLSAELGWEERHPPPNDVYTEIFRGDWKYEIMVAKS